MSEVQVVQLPSRALLEEVTDEFLVYYPENEHFYWVNAVDATEQKMELQFESEIDHSSINWAAEYEFDGQIP